MNLLRLRTIIDMCEGLEEGMCRISELADALQESTDKIMLLLYHNSLVSVTGDIMPGIKAQDIINIIVLYYSLKPHKSFVVTTIH